MSEPASAPSAPKAKAAVKAEALTAPKAEPVTVPVIDGPPGLKIERRYTAAGEDVWKTTEWELRTASIIGGNGEVVFKQDGVEVPKSWSQMATNVVSSKYFRGQIGTLEREYSVKQLVGRVADTFLTWGKQGHYFASDEDASAFHDELRYILIHQLAAFNSPVWFNLGWPGRRQAISACLPYDVRVNTNKGLIPIGEIVRLFQSTPNPQIYTYAPDGTPSRIVNGVRNGRKRVINFHLSDGSTLRCTSNHRVFVRSGKGEMIEKEAGALEVGVDRLILNRSVLIPEMAETCLGLITPDADLAWLTGLMVGDGYCGRSRTLTSDTWDLKICTAQERERAENVLTKYGVPFRAHVKSWGFCLRGHGKVSSSFWRSLGLWGRVNDKEIPEWIYRTSLENVSAFLGGLFDSDGHVAKIVNRRLPVFSNTSLPLVQGVQVLLRSLGIFSSLTSYVDSRSDFARKTSYTLGIHDNVSVDRFLAMVGFTHAEKNQTMSDRQVDAVASWRAPDALLVSKSLGGPEFVYDIQTESETFWAEGILLHNCYINEVGDDMDSILDLYKTEGMLFKDGSGSGLNLSVLRGSREPLAAGGRSSGPISFMKGLDASAGSIKSGGSTRRAACMRVLDVDHPDVMDFINCKKDAEEKAHALIEAGYSGAFNVPNGAYDTVPFQNANHSVRVSDEFMQAVEADRSWETKERLTGKAGEPLRAREVMQKIGEATWVCGDPGMQYDTTINDWHTCSNTDRIYASNPCCITADTLVAVADGRNAVPIKDLVGMEVPVYAHDHATGRTTVSRMWNIGIKRESAPVYRVKLDDGSDFRATDDHLIMLRDGSYRMVKDLNAGDSLMPFHSTVLKAAKSRTKRRYYWNGTGWNPQYRAVWNYVHGAQPEGWHLHHQDFNALNDVATNLMLMPAADHAALHGEKMRGDNNPARRFMTDEWRKNIGYSQRGSKNGNYGRTHSEETRQVMQEKSALRWASEDERVRSGQAIKESLAQTKAEGRPVGRPAGESFERCCPVCRANYSTRRIEQIFCSDACRCSPVGRQMSGEKIWAQTRGRSLSIEHRAKISSASKAAGFDPDTKRRACLVGHRGMILKAARLLMDAGVTPSLEEWDGLRSQAHSLGANHVPAKATVEKHFTDDANLREETALYNHKIVSVEFEGNEDVYDGTVDTHHNFAILTSSKQSCVEGEENYSGIFIHNSEYMFLNSTACNLSSLNLMRFRDERTGAFDVDSYQHVARIMITAQEIGVGFADYPTPKITQRSYDFRTLGLGYANLGALLMASGLPYDSDAGRAYAGAVTAIMTGTAYAQSATIARDCGGPFAGYADNRQPMLRVMKKHRAAVDAVDSRLVPTGLITKARECWDEAIEVGADHGYRNAQVSVLAPTGCLVGESLVLTDRGLMRLNRLGDVNGAAWQDVKFQVRTDDGAQAATKFFINGLAETRRIVTRSGYAIQGTLKHRVKVVDAVTGEMEWKRFAEIAPSDIVALSLGGMVGAPVTVTLPPLSEEYWTGDYTTVVPRAMTADLAELIGYFMGDGSMHSKGPRFCVADADADVADRVRTLVKSLFNLDVKITPQQGYHEVAVHSVPLAIWWEACGFTKIAPSAVHTGKGYRPHIPDAVLAANDPAVYGAFLRGLYEADGTVTGGIPCWSTVCREFSEEVKALLLTMGIPTSTRQTRTGWSNNRIWVLRLRNTSYTPRFLESVSFMGERKTKAVSLSGGVQTAPHDYVYLGTSLIEELAPLGSPFRDAAQMAMRRRGGAVTRRLAQTLFEHTGDARLAQALQFFYDLIVVNEDGGEQMTYDLSVPTNVTYLAGGFISHNTIGFLMDCDTTGVEPDIAIVKYKSLVGGGLMKIVNQTVPEALRRLGYSEAQVGSILEFIDQHDTIEGAPELKKEHLPIFDCAFRPTNGTRTIHYTGHIRMMAAAQPFLSGAISKTINVPEDATAEEISQVYVDSWKMGLKAVAIYRDNSKKTQPLSTKRETTTAVKGEANAEAVKANPVRRKLPDERPSITHKFSVGGHEGYLTVGLYPDTHMPGEIFLRMSKEGSTISGLMDGFATAVSLSLQYGVPLGTLVDKFIHSRFEPSGFTGNKDIPMAKSVMDYIFRWLALKFLQREERQNVGLIADQEPEAPTGQMTLPVLSDPPAAPKPNAITYGNGAKSGAKPEPVNGPAASFTDHEREIFRLQSDAPPCPECGALCIRSGACYKCLQCGTSLGCS